MLTEQERRGVIEDILKKVKVQGKEKTLKDLESVKLYQAHFSHCYLALTDHGGKDDVEHITVSITETFGEIDFEKPELVDGEPFDDVARWHCGEATRVRKEYLGTFKGLVEVLLQFAGTPRVDEHYNGYAEGPHRESLRRIKRKDLRDAGEAPTQQDKELFDAYLKYVQRELSHS